MYAIRSYYDDTLQPFWNDADVRRYAYWSVFAGAFGYTYGSSAVMQFYQPGDKAAAYGAKEYWTKAINDPGANQMKYVKELMLSVITSYSIHYTKLYDILTYFCQHSIITQESL